MSWKLDDIDLKTYGVGVIKTTGLLDIPRMVSEPNNWLDTDGRDFWQDASDVKYGSREIALYCWIKATDYDEYRLKVSAFYTALIGPGQRVLKFDDTVIANVSVQQRVEMVRKTTYVQSEQIGLFTLRLTVSGDVDYFALNISRYYTYNVIATVFTRDLKINKTLQGDSYATFSFESNTKLDIRYFDEINIHSNGTGIADRFYIEKQPEVKKLSNNKYLHTVRCEHMGNWLSHSQFLNDLNEADFSYFANMQEIVDLIIANHSKDYPSTKFLRGTIETTERRLHKFSAEDCLSVLRRLASEYKLEYEFEFDNTVNWQYNINVKTQVANDKTVTLEYGKGKGLLELTRGEMIQDELCTILHAFGASKNLKPGYRSGLRRLSFDGNPLKQNAGFDYPAGDWGVHAKTVFFDEIFPRRTATITSYLQKLPAALTDAEKYTYPEGIFRITDSTIDFDINAYLLGGLTAKVKMQTGDLAGFEFEITRYDHANKQIYIIPFKDERGELYPTEVITIRAGDTYTLIDIDQPASYVAAAEAELAAAADAYLTEHSTPKYPYRAIVDPAWIKSQTQPFGFEVGDRVPFVASEFNLNGPLRINSLVYDVYKRTYDLTLSEVAKIPKLKKTEMRLQAIERVLGDAKKDTIEATRKDQETTNELRNRLLDPTDDKLNADRNVRVESLDPGMLAFDAGVPQWSVKNALIEPNVGGDEDVVKVGAGHLIISNFYTLDRYAIQKLKDNSQVYDPTRIWVIPETTLTLATKDAYFIYAKLTLSEGSTACQIVAYPDHVEMKLQHGYLYIKLAGITSGEEATA